jgi:Rrf2 family protein
LAYLARHAESGKVLVKDIARQENMPYHYIGKLLQQMKKLGFVESWQGRGGGFKITEHGKECSILEIISSLQGNFELDTRFFEFEHCDADGNCSFCKKWQYINEQITTLLMTQKVKDFLS